MCISDDISDTIVAPITAVIQSAVIVVRVSGSNALKSFDLIRDRTGKKIVDPVPNHVYFVRFISETDNIQDDILITYFKSPYSYTGEDCVELSFHGNPILVSIALTSLYSLGFRAATNGEFTKRSFLNGKLSITEAEAIQELISANSETSLKYAYSQLNGSVARIFNQFKSKLLELKAVLEADIDFADDSSQGDLMPLMSTSVDSLLDEIEELLLSYRYLKSVNNEVKVVIVGKPNVGKSSLLNVLIDSDRAIVSDIAGTTRDYINEKILISGIPILITDTAGIRKTEDKIESLGISQSLNQLSVADIIILLLDRSSNLSEDDTFLLDMISSNNRVIKVGNKSDLDSILSDELYDIAISTKTGSGIDDLKSRIMDYVAVDKSIEIGSVAIVSDRHAEILNLVKSTLLRIRENINSNETEDIFIFDLNEAIRYIELITGERYTEDILSIIFDKFCIGK